MICLLATLVLLLLVGCDESKPATPAPAAAVLGEATVTGHIHFAGNPPERKVIDISTCEEGARVYQEETIILGEGGALKDAVVYLKDAPPSTGSANPEVVFDQIGCRFVPHVLALQTGQPLKIRTSDTAFHNVHWISDANGSFNQGFNRVGQEMTVHLDKPDFLRVRCDVHSWMNAAIAVVPNPFFAVSDGKGAFTISKVPPGNYTLAVWHPILGERSKSIEVGASGQVTADLEYAPPARK